MDWRKITKIHIHIHFHISGKIEMINDELK